MKELLSPAGNMECLKAAIHNGADAIYLGGKSFGARAFAGNFTNEELKEAVNYAHLYGVKIYIDDLLHRAVVSKGARKPKVFLMKKMKKMSKNS